MAAEVKAHARGSIPEVRQQTEREHHGQASWSLPILLKASCSSSSSSREMVVVLFSIFRQEGLLQVFLSRKNVLQREY